MSAAPAPLLLVSVPGHDELRVRRALPEARWTAKPLPGVSPDPACEVLALTIHDRLDPAGWDRLRAVITRSDGHDHLALEVLRDAGIAVYHLGEYATRAVAEHTLGLILALLRRVPEATATTRGGSWARERLQGRTLGEVTVGIVGAGRIGGALARMLTGLGVDVLANDVAPDRSVGVPLVSLDELLARADVVTLHVPGSPQTDGLLDASRIASLRPGALVVNTARGSVLDQHAVRAALRDGRLGGYAADVLPDEPRPALDVWRGFETVLLTPHLGAHTPATIDRRYEFTARIARAVLAGREAEVAAFRVA